MGTRVYFVVCSLRNVIQCVQRFLPERNACPRPAGSFFSVKCCAAAGWFSIVDLEVALHIAETRPHTQVDVYQLACVTAFLCYYYTVQPQTHGFILAKSA